jgi:DNA-binding NarL/FixJ family response regulator
MKVTLLAGHCERPAGEACLVYRPKDPDTHCSVDICSVSAMAHATATPIRILLADAHAATLAGLRMAISGEPFMIVAEVADAGTAVEAALRERPDICILDADMPGGAVGATAEITRCVPEGSVVVFGSSRDDAVMLDVVRAGAVGYLLKNIDPERLRYALVGVTQGEAALPRTLVTRLMLEFRVRERRRHVPIGGGEAAELTAREWDVLALMSEGGSTKDIAGTLGISEVTVRRHISGLLAKLRVPDREAAVAILRNAGRP